jgi:hypothetical protein
VQGLFQETAMLNHPFLRKGLISIDKDSISFRVNGILKKLEVMRQIFSVLTRLANRIESQPVV